MYISSQKCRKKDAENDLILLILEFLSRVLKKKRYIVGTYSAKIVEK